MPKLHTPKKRSPKTITKKIIFIESEENFFQIFVIEEADQEENLFY